MVPDKVVVPPAHTAVGLAPAVAAAFALTLIILFALAAVHPAGILVVNVKVTVPVKFAAGVYVTAAGLAV